MPTSLYVTKYRCESGPSDDPSGCMTGPDPLEWLFESLNAWNPPSLLACSARMDQPSGEWAGRAPKFCACAEPGEPWAPQPSFRFVSSKPPTVAGGDVGGWWAERYADWI